VQIIAGDTKVVQKGKADGLYITTSGVGTGLPGVDIRGANACPGDIVILSGPVGDHGIAVLEARGELGFQAGVHSDVAPLNHMVLTLLDAVDGVHVLRDPTRGGLATTLNEIARQSSAAIFIDERKVPVRQPIAAACEMLGFDPLYIANEGKLIAVVDRTCAETALQALRSCRYGEEAAIIGEVREAPQKRVILRTEIGTTRVLDMLSGELLPRIC
jgi:hydrogenase expression/formation protein HypE